MVTIKTAPTKESNSLEWFSRIVPISSSTMLSRCAFKKAERVVVHTETNKKAWTRLREFCSCSCLTALPGLALVLLSKIYITFCSPLYLMLNMAHTSWSDVRIHCPRHLFSSRMQVCGWIRPSCIFHGFIIIITWILRSAWISIVSFQVWG